METSDLETATHLLGRPYSISGRVIKGDQIGRLMGFPTANLEVDSTHKLIPADGIYAVTIVHEHAVYDGMLYIGDRPTVNGSKKNIEVNIFNFNKDIYGESLVIHLQKFIREDRKFDDVEELTLQISRDKEASIGILNNLRKTKLK